MPKLAREKMISCESQLACCNFHEIGPGTGVMEMGWMMCIESCRSLGLNGEKKNCPYPTFPGENENFITVHYNNL